MPTAEKFETEGYDNGFPFCPYKVNVLSGSFIKWSTAGGYTSDSTGEVTDFQISESRRLAMLWFWNSYKLNGHARIATLTEVTEVNTEDHVVNGYSPITYFPAMPPKKRICLSEDSQQNKDNELSYVMRHRDNYTSYLWTEAQIDIGVIAMYKGSTDDPANFIGYGINGAYFYLWDQGSIVEGWVEIGATLQLSGFSNDYEDWDSTFGTFPIGNDNIHVVRSAHAYSGDGLGAAADATNLTITIPPTSPYGTASMTSLDLYTY